MVGAVDRTGPPKFSRARLLVSILIVDSSFLGMDWFHSSPHPYPLPLSLPLRFRFSTLLPPIPNFLLPTNLSYSSFIVGDVSVSLFDRSNVLRVPLYVLPGDTKEYLPRVAFGLVSKTTWTLYHSSGRLCFHRDTMLSGTSFVLSTRKLVHFYS